MTPNLPHPITLKNRRIALVGRPGCGKTTLARRLAPRLGLPHVELDLLFWQGEWQGTPTPEFRQKVATALSGPAWLTDNYFIEIRDLVWGWADTVIWLDYPFWLTTRWFLKRNLGAWASGSDIWGQNKLTWRAFFHAEPPLLWWMWHTFATRPRHYERIFSQPPYNHVRLIRLTHPAQTDRWLETIG
jgi:hypothetical protein